MTILNREMTYDALRKRVAELEAQLAQAKARVAELEALLAARG